MSDLDPSEQYVYVCSRHDVFSREMNVDSPPRYRRGKPLWRVRVRRAWAVLRGRA